MSRVALIAGDDDDDALARRRVRATRATSSDVGLFFADAIARASPVALGVVVARVVGRVVESFIDAFVAPCVAIALGSRGRDLERMSFAVRDVRFAYGAFAAETLSGFCTLALMYGAVRLAASVSRRTSTPLWTPSARCDACKSWIARDATRCPMCRARVDAGDDAGDTSDARGR